MLKYFLFSFYLLFVLISFSQKEKQIRKFQISSITESKTDSTQKIIQTQKTLFDKKGNKIEEDIYSKTGKYKGKYQRKFNSSNEIEEEKIFDENGTLIQIIIYKYKLDLLISVSTFDVNNKLQETEDYIYNGFSEKIEEIKKDSEGKMLEKSSYEYDNKGLKTKKTTFDKNNKIIEIKSYQYTFE